MRRELDTQIVSGFLKNVQIYIYIESMKLSNRQTNASGVSRGGTGTM